jgi:hypothetical protein
MLHASTQKLILKLCDITERAEAPWKEGEDGASWFETEGYKIEVKPEPPHIRILQANGREVESADAAQLASAPFPGLAGQTYADRVRTMGVEAKRIARGAETAISTILSALSNPPAAEPHFSTEGGPESEAAMAAAVADMAERLKHQPAEAPRAPEPDARELAAVSAAPPVTPRLSAAPARMLRGETPTRTVSTAAMFGAIPSFSQVRPAAPAPRVDAPKPAPQTTKVTASGLVLTGIHATSIQTPEVMRPNGSAADPKRPNVAAYRPWT